MRYITVAYTLTYIDIRYNLDKSFDSLNTYLLIIYLDFVISLDFVVEKCTIHIPICTIRFDLQQLQLSLLPLIILQQIASIE